MTEIHRDFYSVLGITPDAPQDVIKSAYRTLAKQYHPDLGGAGQADATPKFIELQEAYEILSDPLSRSEYDSSNSNSQSTEFSAAPDEDTAHIDPEEVWQRVAVAYPEIDQIHAYLLSISIRLANRFRIAVIDGECDDDPVAFGSNLEGAFFERYFGRSPEVRDCAKRLLLAGHRDAARALNKAVKTGRLETDQQRDRYLSRINDEYFSQDTGPSGSPDQDSNRSKSVMGGPEVQQPQRVYGSNSERGWTGRNVLIAAALAFCMAAIVVVMKVAAPPPTSPPPSARAEIVFPKPKQGPPIAKVEPQPPKPDPPVVKLEPEPPVTKLKPEPILKRDPPVARPEPKPEPKRIDLASLPCSKLQLTNRAGRQVLSGYVGKPEDIVVLEGIYKSTDVKYEVDVRPWPQCEILLTLDKPLAAADGPKVSIAGGRHSAIEGEHFTVNVMTPSTASYIYVSYIQGDGKVVHLQQPPALAPKPVMPRNMLTFGDGKGGTKFTVAPPFGSELFVVLASQSPLFDSALPLDQIERDYLTAIRKALIYKPDPSMPDRVVSASYVVLETKGK